MIDKPREFWLGLDDIKWRTGKVPNSIHVIEKSAYDELFAMQFKSQPFYYHEYLKLQAKAEKLAEALENIRQRELSFKKIFSNLNAHVVDSQTEYVAMQALAEYRGEE